MKKPIFNPRNEVGKRLLIEWTIKQWEEMQTPTEDELARDYTLIEFPASAVPAEAKVSLALAIKDRKMFRQLMLDPTNVDEVYRRLKPTPPRGVGQPKGTKSREAAKGKDLKAWAFKVEGDILLIWANAYGDDAASAELDRKEAPFALDIAVEIVNSMGKSKLSAEDLRSYRRNRGTRGLPKD